MGFFSFVRLGQFLILKEIKQGGKAAGNKKARTGGGL